MSRLLPRTLLGSLHRNSFLSASQSRLSLSTSSWCSQYKQEPWEEIYTAEAIGQSSVREAREGFT